MTVLAGREDAVVKAYVDGKSARRLAHEFGVGDQTIRRLLEARGVTRRRGQPAGCRTEPAEAPPTDASVSALSLTELAYIAGLIDGEGCLLIYRKRDPRGGLHFRCILRVSNTSQRVIEWLQLRLGGGAQAGQPPQPNHLRVFHWRCEGPRMAALLVAVRPFLVIKPELADLLLAMQRTLTYSASGLRLPPDVAAERELIFAQYQVERREMKGR
ncbi:hypothetical protein AB0M36_27555 [Actinoplanes sp. NPDC051346]|uniref:hypothetical protein n=1 Tax=Actinoplanes sp. NPDC051346 TaxID=3155048 RepID=UPI00341797F1